MYDQLLFIFGQAQAACGPVWPETFHPWGAIFLADYVRGVIEAPEFIRMMTLINSDYLALSECIVRAAGG